MQYRSDRDIAKHASRWLEGKGYKIIRDAAQIGKTTCIEIEYRISPVAKAAKPADPFATARRLAKKFGFEREPFETGTRLLIPVSKYPVSKHKKRAGRPFESDLRKLVMSLRSERLTFSTIAERVEQQTGIRRSPDAYRKLLRNPEGKSPTGNNSE